MFNIELKSTYTLAESDVPVGGKRFISRHHKDSDTHDTLDILLTACTLEFEDLCYSHNSAVTLPVLPTSAGDDASTAFEKILPDDVSSVEEFNPAMCDSFASRERSVAFIDEEAWRRSTLNLIAITYHFLKKNPAYKLLVAGHTDQSGEDEYNFVLSEKRARNVMALLKGDRDAWLETITNQYRVEDYQRICAHYAEFFGWDCHPGPVDGDHGQRTSTALRDLQAYYNNYFDKNISVDGIIGPQTWGAIFDLYMEELAGLLGIERDGLEGQRADLRLVDDTGFIACGERFPIDEPCRDSFRSVRNRRVELLFFNEDYLPDLQSHRAGGSIRSGKGGAEESAAYRPGHPRHLVLLPVWWEGEPPPDTYTPKFEVYEIEDDMGDLDDDPESDEFDSESSAGSEEEDPEDDWAFLDDIDDMGRAWRGSHYHGGNITS